MISVRRRWLVKTRTPHLGCGEKVRGKSGGGEAERRQDKPSAQRVARTVCSCRRQDKPSALMQSSGQAIGPERCKHQTTMMMLLILEMRGEGIGEGGWEVRGGR